jgi:hypothetical protein
MDETGMNIVVCGDSFCASPVGEIRSTGLRAHFSQILEDQYGYQVLNLAHGGMSNTAIWFQIDQAIKLKPDVIVYGKTWSSRIELYLKDKLYNITNPLRNFIYYDPCYSSTHTSFVGTFDDESTDGGMAVSTSWQNIENSPFFDLSDEQIKAVKLYFKYMYNDSVCTQRDSWVFEYWHSQIQAAGILSLCFKDADIGQVAYNFSAANRDYDSPFHTDRATQEIVAANIHRRIVDSMSQNK